MGVPDRARSASMGVPDRARIVRIVLLRVFLGIVLSRIVRIVPGSCSDLAEKNADYSIEAASPGRTGFKST